MPIVFPENLPTPTPEDALAVTGFKEASIAVPDHLTGTGAKRKPVGVVFTLSRPPSAFEVLIAQDHSDWYWLMREGDDQLSVQMFDTRNVVASLAEVRTRLAAVSEKARKLEAANGELVDDVAETLRQQLPAV